MQNLKAPLAVFTIGLIGAIVVGEPLAAVLTTMIAAIGYSLNKAGN